MVKISFKFFYMMPIYLTSFVYYFEKKQELLLFISNTGDKRQLA